MTVPITNPKTITIELLYFFYPNGQRVTGLKGGYTSQKAKNIIDNCRKVLLIISACLVVASVAVGVLLVILLMFFIVSYYVNPLNRMLAGLDDYRSMGRRYGYAFEGDDQLADLNQGITELTEENRQYRRRIKLLKETQSRTEETE